MALFSWWFVAVFLLIFPLLANADVKYTICTTPKFINECEQINRTELINCIVLADDVSCIERIDGGGASFGSVSAEGAFIGSSKTNLVKLATFTDGSNAFDLQTAIVTNQNIGNDLTNLMNATYCHSGFDNSNVNPLLLTEFETHLLSKNGINICTNDTISLIEKHIKAVYDFFGPSCRPGRWVQDDELDARLKLKYSRLIQLCNTTAYQSNSGGAFQQSLDCLLNSKGPAVALTTVSTIVNQQQSGSFTAYTICRNGTVSDINQGLCEWSTLPNRVVIANKNVNTGLLEDIQDWFRNSIIPEEFAGTMKLNPNQINLLKTLLFPEPDKYKMDFGQGSPLGSLYEYTSSFRRNLTSQGSRQCSTEMRWCTDSNDEQSKCEAWSRAALNFGIQPVLGCVQRATKRECIDTINMNSADVTRIGADFGYFAKLAGLEAIAFPEAVREALIRTLLVVKPNITRLENLKGKRGCFSRYGSAAWVSFVVTTRSIILSKDTCEYGKLLSEALGNSCMPGAGSLKFDNLCALCVSNSTDEQTCAINSSNKYFGNQGALDCLRDVGEFAVISKQDELVVPENVTVMCKNGSLASAPGLDVDDNCYLSIITTDEIVTRRDDPKNLDVQLALLEYDWRFAVDPKTPFKLFATFDGKPNLIFRDSTPGLALANSENSAIKNYRALFQHIDECSKSGSVKNMASISALAFTLVALWITLYI